MSHGWLSLAVALLLLQQETAAKRETNASSSASGGSRAGGAANAGAQSEDDIVVVKRPVRKRSGRLGENSEAEEERLDKIVNDFILHDLGARPNPGSARELESLGAEAIPAIVRGINKSAGYSHSCPVTVLAAKLISLIKQSDDPEVLRFIRFEVGAGTKTVRYAGLLNRVKTETTLRQAELTRLAKIAEKNRPKSPGEGSGKDGGKDPGKGP